MTTTAVRTTIATELYAHVPPQYQTALGTMLARVPNAQPHFEAGNVHMAFRLLSESDKVSIPQKWGVTKEQVLNNIMLALPSTYQIGDMDPDFEP